MYIHEAVKLAVERGRCVTRAAWGKPCHFWIYPTNTPDCCVAQSDITKNSRRGWQPKAEDLTADDWITTAK